MVSHLVLATWLLSFIFAVSSTAPPNIQYSNEHEDCVDVVIIGGGAAGTYSAVRLVQENKTVAVIEKQDRLGGSVATFMDSKTNQTSDYGVILYHNSSVVNSFFEFFKTPLIVGTFGNVTSEYADFNSLRKVDAPSAPSLAAIATAIEQFVALDFPTDVGYQDLPEEVPDDLLLPLPEFLAQYNISALAYVINQATVGYNLWELPALYAVKLLNPTFLAALETGFLTTANHNNQQTFDKAQDFLGPHVHFQSEPTKVVRRNDSVIVTVRTTSGTRTIKASHLLMAMPPYLADLQQYLDLTPEESSLFGQMANHTYAGAVIQNAGIPPNIAIRNSNPTLPFATFNVPGMSDYTPNLISGFNNVYYINDDDSTLLSDDQIKDSMLHTLDQVKQLYQYQGNSSQQPEIVSFLRHSPFQQHVSATAIKSGFYRRLVGLQGKRRTYWTGAAWVGHDSSAIWEYTEKVVLPGLLRA